MNFGERVMAGLGVAGWMIGFLAGLGVFLIVVGLVVLTFQWLAQMLDDNEEREEETEDDGKSV